MKNLTPSEKAELMLLNAQHISCGLSADKNASRVALSHKYNASPEGKAAETAFVNSIDR